MLGFNVSVSGDKIILNGLDNFSRRGLGNAVKRGLKRIVKGIHRAAYDYLSGPGAEASQIPPGGYPVPVRTGHLRRMLNFLYPGAVKEAGGHTFRAGDMEAVVYDAAEYSEVIHAGTHSSSRYGSRPYITGAFEFFNQGEKVARVINEEIKKETDKI